MLWPLILAGALAGGASKAVEASNKNAQSERNAAGNAGVAAAKPYGGGGEISPVEHSSVLGNALGGGITGAGLAALTAGTPVGKAINTGLEDMWGGLMNMFPSKEAAAKALNAHFIDVGYTPPNPGL